jgi:hypothetical protein
VELDECEESLLLGVGPEHLQDSWVEAAEPSLRALSARPMVANELRDGRPIVESELVDRAQKPLVLELRPGMRLAPRRRRIHNRKRLRRRMDRVLRDVQDRRDPFNRTRRMDLLEKKSRSSFERDHIADVVLHDLLHRRKTLARDRRATVNDIALGDSEKRLELARRHQSPKVTPTGNRL